jgi:hypothetical protein
VFLFVTLLLLFGPLALETVAPFALTRDGARLLLLPKSIEATLLEVKEQDGSIGTGRTVAQLESVGMLGFATHNAPGRIDRHLRVGQLGGIETVAGVDRMAIIGIREGHGDLW